MKVFKLYLLGFFVSAVAQAGAGGHGTDNLRPDHGAAWFLQKGRAIKYCVVTSSQFGVDENALKQDIAAAFDQWNSYIKDRVGHGSPVNSQFTYIGNCQDTKGKEDLSFYFGITNALITKAKKLYDDPIAMAQKISYDKEKGWGKGFIWAVNSQEDNPKEKFPNWGEPNNRYAMLLHEIGHVLGCDHIEGTIMTKDLAKQIRLEELKNWPRSIDMEIELVDRYIGVHTGSVYDVHNSSHPDSPKLAKLFKIFVGKDPIGDVNVTYLSGFSKKTRSYTASYVISDKTGDYKFPLKYTDHNWSMDEGYMFTYLDKGSSYYNGYALQGGVKHADVTYFSLTTKKGEKIAIVEKRNLAWQPLQVDAALDGEMTNIFTSDQAGDK